MEAYIDSNIFIYSLTDETEYGDKCRALLKSVREGNIKAVTSALTFNESVHIITRFKSYKNAVEFGEILTSTPNLKIIDLDLNILHQATQLMKKYTLRPGDAIHIATAIHSKAEVVYSRDKDFGKVKEITLKTP